MNNETERTEIDISKSFEKALNLHGYGFQYSVAKQAEDLFNQRKSPWALAVSEFPVSGEGFDARIDLIFRNTRRSLYLISECKRANPAISNWCFAKASYVPHIERASCAFYEVVSEVKTNRIVTSLVNLIVSENIYHVAIEVKTGDKGDEVGKVRGEIERASTQVCRGLNGIINLFSRSRDSFGRDHSVGFLPVIFTTAELFISDVNLSLADIETGEIESSSFSIEQKSWIFYHYNQSLGLKHSLPVKEKRTDLKSTLYSDYVRTIAIVSSSGISSFLRSSIFE